MKYVALIGTEGPQPPEALAIMQRDLPAWIEEVDGRGVRLLGRELELPDSAATVRVRDGQTLVSDGPFAETKEFVAGFDLFDCDDLEEAIEVVSTSPVARFCPFEIRALGDGLRLGPDVTAFGRSDDSAGTPYLLSAWVSRAATASLDDRDLTEQCEAWRDDLASRGILVLGDSLRSPETARTVRVREGELQLTDGSFLNIEESLASIDVVRCADREQALQLAATHPLARDHVIEVRPFYSE